MNRHPASEHLNRHAPDNAGNSNRLNNQLPRLPLNEDEAGNRFRSVVIKRLYVEQV